MDVIEFIADPYHDFLGTTIQYLKLCGISAVLAMLIGIGLAILVSRNAIAAFTAVNLSGLMRAIPVIAFLIAAIPFLGVGELPAIVALVVLGIPPILLNTYTGIRSVNPATIDAAKGIGMTAWQIITRVQAPLVLPTIAAGVRTATVQIIATATLAAFIGAGGYGNYIVDGVATFKNEEILAGAIPVAMLALIIEVFMSRLEYTLTPEGIRYVAPTETTRA